MITASQVKWGGYKQYEGAYFHGSRKFVLPSNPTSNDLIMSVITSTEGGSANAINAYDRCIISVGYFQWCEAAWFLTSNLLGNIANKDFNLLDPLLPALGASGASFKQKAGGKWRFFVGNNEVDDREEQQRLFLLNSNGLKGSWDSKSKEHVKLWVASLANTLAQDEADRIQVSFTSTRVRSFATKKAKDIVFDEKPDTGWVGGLRAAFLSFAANLPAVASEQLQIAVKNTSAPKWSEDWCINVLKQLTFGPNITIYPGRYNKIRPVIEKHYGIDLPDFADDLQKWKSKINHDIDAPCGSEPTFETVEEIQELLARLGYDLGPAGVDGKLGKKTYSAIRAFQSVNKLIVDGKVGPKTRAKMLDAYRNLK